MPNLFILSLVAPSVKLYNLEISEIVSFLSKRSISIASLDIIVFLYEISIPNLFIALLTALSLVIP